MDDLERNIDIATVIGLRNSDVHSDPIGPPWLRSWAPTPLHLFREREGAHHRTREGEPSASLSAAFFGLRRVITHEAFPVCLARCR